MGAGYDHVSAGRRAVADRLRTVLPVASTRRALDVDQIEARRRRLVLVAAFAGVGAAAIAAAALVFDQIELPTWVALALVAVTGLFFFDTNHRERTLREVVRRAVTEETRAREFEETLHQLSALQEIARRVNAVLLPEEIYETVLDGAVELLDASHGTIRLRVDDELTVAASSGPDASPIGDTRPIAGDPAAPAVTIGITVAEEGPPRLVVPIVVGERIVGVLGVVRPADAEPFSDRREVLASLFADVAATAFVNANRYDHQRVRADSALSVSADRSAAVADAVHDLRAPIAAIVGFAQLLRDRHDALPPDERRELVTSVLTQAQRLDHRVEGVFEAASAEARASSVREPVHVGDVVRDVVDVVRASADRRGWRHALSTDIDEEAVACCDPAGLRRVVTNLVGNAVEHAGPDVLIRVQRRGGEVRLHVADSGAGLESDAIDALFTRDRDADGSPRGRGLPIVDTLVRSMGGRVGVRSQVGVGTVFTVVLPRAR